MNLQKFLHKNPVLLEKPMPKILNIQAHLKLKNDASPVFVSARKVPYWLRSEVEEELSKLEKE